VRFQPFKGHCWHQGLPTRGLALEDFDPADFYGDKEWQEKVKNSLKERFAHLRPRYHVGMVASSDKIVENQRLTTQIKSFIRSVCLLETELAGICRAAENRPVLGICGIGSIVGLKAGFSWQEYAARSAAALTFALLSKTDPIEKTVPNKVGQSIPGATSTKPVSGAKVALQVRSNQQHKVIYDQKLALLPEVEAPMSSPLYWPAQNA
jgi:hypothetical protein